MQRILTTVSVVSAIVILSTVIAVNASATLWLSSGASLSSEVAATIHGRIIWHHKGGSTGNSDIECSGLFVVTIGGGSKFKISLIEGLSGAEKDLIKCKALEGCFVSEPTVHAVHFPWSGELVLEGGVTWAKQKGTGGEPGYEDECLFGIKVTCATEEKAKFTSNGASGAEFSYEGAESGEATCSDGGVGRLIGKFSVLSFSVS